jgi:hypothetical protein
VTKDVILHLYINLIIELNMKTQFKVIAMKKATEALVGMRVPEQKNGNVGHLVEDRIYDAGYGVDKQSTVDIPKLKVEIKSRTKEATSAHAIGSMTISDIINTPYNASPIKEKFQQQFRVTHSDTFREVVSAKIYDFSDPYIQKLIEKGYEAGREIFAKLRQNNEVYPNYVRGEDTDFYWEKKESNSYAFRLSDSAMKGYEGMATSTFNSLFE